MKPRIQQKNPHAVTLVSAADTEESDAFALQNFSFSYRGDEMDPMWEQIQATPRHWIRNLIYDVSLSKPCTFYLYIQKRTQHKASMGVKKAIEVVAYLQYDQIVNLLHEVCLDFMRKLRFAPEDSPLKTLNPMIQAIFDENNFQAEKTHDELIKDSYNYFIKGERSFFTRFHEIAESISKATLQAEHRTILEELCATVKGLCLFLSINHTRILLYDEINRNKASPERLMIKMANYPLYQLMPLTIGAMESCIEDFKHLAGYSSLWENVENLKTICAELITVRKFSFECGVLDLKEKLPVELAPWFDKRMYGLSNESSIACQELACYLLGFYYQLCERGLTTKQVLSDEENRLIGFYRQSLVLFKSIVQKFKKAEEEDDIAFSYESEGEEGISLEDDPKSPIVATQQVLQSKSKGQPTYFADDSKSAADETISSYLSRTSLSSLRVQIPKLQYAFSHYPMGEKLREQLNLFLQTNKVDQMLHSYLNHPKSIYLRFLTCWLRSDHNLGLARKAYAELQKLKERQDFAEMTPLHINMTISILVNLWSNLISVPSGTLRPQVEAVLQGLIDISLTYDRVLSQGARHQDNAAFF